MKFFVGDKVRYIGDDAELKGLVGKVLGMGRNAYSKEMWICLFTDYGDIACYDDELELMKVRGFEKVYYAPEETKLPTRSTMFSAGYDFFAPCDIIVPAHGYSELIPLNIKAYMQRDEYLALLIRSSLATTKGDLIVAQGTGIIDSDYYANPTNDGNIHVRLYNRGEEKRIKMGERICQGIFCKYLLADEDYVTAQRIGGHGSTGR